MVPRFTKPLVSFPLVPGLGVCLAWGRPGAGWEWGYLFNPQHQQLEKKKCLLSHLELKKKKTFVPPCPQLHSSPDFLD